MPRRSSPSPGGPGAGGGGLGAALLLTALLLTALLLAAAPRAVCGLRWEADATSFEWVELEDSPEWGAQPAADAPLGTSAVLGGARGLLRNIPRCASP